MVLTSQKGRIFSITAGRTWNLARYPSDSPSSSPGLFTDRTRTSQTHYVTAIKLTTQSASLCLLKILLIPWMGNMQT